MYMSIGVVLSGMVIVGPATFKACSHTAALWTIQTEIIGLLQMLSSQHLGASVIFCFTKHGQWEGKGLGPL